MVIELKHVKKIYDKNGIEVVKDFNLTIEDKEFVVFVGPSGCGKSTTLRMIAGLEDITGGTISFDGEIINNKLPGERNIGMVFQSYALYPNMTVYKNMEFPLKIAKVPKEERKRRILEAAQMLGLTEYLERKPKNLSGGQRQRVAVGREIVRDCNLFLFDEPLSNLDAKLRVQMRTEIANLHRRLQKTFIYVTHDQIEAMTMATRIVIMYNGIVQQVGAPKEVYDWPENMFVAGFIGTPAMNFIEGIVAEDGYFRSIERDSTLKSLTIDSNPLPDFYRNTYNYVYEYKSEDAGKKVNIEAISSSKIAKVEYTNNIILSEGATATIKVTAENGSSSNYTITLKEKKEVKPKKGSDDADVSVEEENVVVESAVKKALSEEKAVNKIQIKLPKDKFELLKENGYLNKQVVLGIRPENITDTSHDGQMCDLVVESAELLGFEYNLIMDICGSQVISRINATNIIRPGDKVKLSFDLSKAHFFDKETTNRIKAGSNNDK